MCFSYVFDELCCFYAAAMLLASVRKRTIPTERPPLASEISANFFVDRGET
jgi:hypothetical protein